MIGEIARNFSCKVNEMIENRLGSSIKQNDFYNDSTIEKTKKLAFIALCDLASIFAAAGVVLTVSAPSFMAVPCIGSTILILGISSIAIGLFTLLPIYALANSIINQSKKTKINLEKVAAMDPAPRSSDLGLPSTENLNETIKCLNLIKNEFDKIEFFKGDDNHFYKFITECSQLKNKNSVYFYKCQRNLDRPEYDQLFNYVNIYVKLISGDCSEKIKDNVVSAKNNGVNSELNRASENLNLVQVNGKQHYTDLIVKEFSKINRYKGQEYYLNNFMQECFQIKDQITLNECRQKWELNGDEHNNLFEYIKCFVLLTNSETDVRQSYNDNNLQSIDYARIDLKNIITPVLNLRNKSTMKEIQKLNDDEIANLVSCNEYWVNYWLEKHSINVRQANLAENIRSAVRAFETEIYRARRDLLDLTDPL